MSRSYAEKSQNNFQTMGNSAIWEGAREPWINVNSVMHSLNESAAHLSLSLTLIFKWNFKLFTRNKKKCQMQVIASSHSGSPFRMYFSRLTVCSHVSLSFLLFWGMSLFLG